MNNTLTPQFDVSKVGHNVAQAEEQNNELHDENIINKDLNKPVFKPEKDQKKEEEMFMGEEVYQETTLTRPAL